MRVCVELQHASVPLRLRLTAEPFKFPNNSLSSDSPRQGVLIANVLDTEARESDSFTSINGISKTSISDRGKPLFTGGPRCHACVIVRFQSSLQASWTITALAVNCFSTYSGDAGVLRLFGFCRRKDEHAYSALLMTDRPAQKCYRFEGIFVPPMAHP